MSRETSYTTQPPFFGIIFRVWRQTWRNVKDPADVLETGECRCRVEGVHSHCVRQYLAIAVDKARYAVNTVVTVGGLSIGMELGVN
jgi:hypothetical protein